MYAYYAKKDPDYFQRRVREERLKRMSQAAHRLRNLYLRHQIGATPQDLFPTFVRIANDHQLRVPENIAVENFRDYLDIAAARMYDQTDSQVYAEMVGYLHPVE